MLYGELALTQRILRDFIGAGLEKIRIDSKLCFTEVKQFTEEFMPTLVDKLVLYSGISLCLMCMAWRQRFKPR